MNLIPQDSPSEHSTSVSISADDKNNHHQQQQLAPISGIRQVGQWGNGPMEFWCPCGLAITRNNEHLIVIDSWNHRLQVSSEKVEPIKSYIFLYRC